MSLLISDTGTRVWVGGGMYDFAPYGPIVANDSRHPWTPALQREYDACLEVHPDPSSTHAISSRKVAFFTLVDGIVEAVEDDECRKRLDAEIQRVLLNRSVEPLPLDRYVQQAIDCHVDSEWFPHFNEVQCLALVDALCYRTGDEHELICPKASSCNFSASEH